MGRYSVARWAIVVSLCLLSGCMSPGRLNPLARFRRSAGGNQSAEDKLAEKNPLKPTNDESEDSESSASGDESKLAQSIDLKEDKVVTHDADTLRLIEEELSHASPEERDRLRNEWKPLEPAMVRQIVSIRRMVRQFGQGAPGSATGHEIAQISANEGAIDQTWPSRSNAVNPAVASMLGSGHSGGESATGGTQTAGLGSADPWARSIEYQADQFQQTANRYASDKSAADRSPADGMLSDRSIPTIRPNGVSAYPQPGATGDSIHHAAAIEGYGSSPSGISPHTRVSQSIMPPPYQPSLPPNGSTPPVQDPQYQTQQQPYSVAGTSAPNHGPRTVTQLPMTNTNAYTPHGGSQPPSYGQYGQTGDQYATPGRDYGPSATAGQNQPNGPHGSFSAVGTGQGYDVPEYEPPAGSRATLGWGEDLQRLIAMAESDVVQSAPGATDIEQRNYIEKQVYLRMLYLMSGQQVRALEPIPGIEPSDQEFWQQVFWGLASYFDFDAIPDGHDRATQAIIQFRSAVQRLQQQARLELRNVTFCHKISSYGNYERFKRDEFSPGQPVLVYSEVNNFSSEPTSDGQYRTILKSTIEIFNAQGNLVKVMEFQETEDLCRNHRRDYFHSYEFTVPADISLGPHILKLTVVDQLSQKVAEYSLNFTVN